MDDKTEIQQLIRETRAEYYGAWRAKNKDKVAAINRRYWIKKAAARLAERQKERHDEIDD